MIQRPRLVKQIQTALRRSRVVALIGPRQCGKTTLARQFLDSGSPHYFDLEDPDHLARLDEPKTALAALRGLVVIDEIQRRPDLFALIRVLADRKPLPARFLILGSAGHALLRQSSESLAGRMETVLMSGFSMEELGAKNWQKHWLRGGFPKSFLARSERDSFVWRKQFVQTFLERDVPQMGLRIPAPMFRRFWSMVAHLHGQIWNAADLAASLGVSQPTVRKYLDHLENLLMVRQLQPWHANLAKRQVKAPKIYVRDAGLLHLLLGVGTAQALEVHPKKGSSWEGYVLEEILKLLGSEEAYFWATHNRAELDLLMIKSGKSIGFEIKYGDAPRLTPSMRIAMSDLKLDRLFVIYPGETRYAISKKIEAVPLRALAKLPF